MLDQSEGVLKVIATHGYENDGIGAEVAIGVGVIGVVAKKKKINANGKHWFPAKIYGIDKKTN